MSIHSSARQWLLEAPITSSLGADFGGRLPFPLLTDGEEPGDVFDLNLRPHGMTSWLELTEELWGLAEAGLVSFKQEIPSREELTRQLRIPREAECPIFRNNNAYTLTQAGFEEWERLASPDWDRFVTSACGGSDSHCRLQVIGVSADVAKAAFDVLSKSYEISECNLNCSLIEITDWQALPWKHFPRGWMIETEFEETDSFLTDSDELDWDPVHWIRFPVTQDGMRPTPATQDPTS